MICQSQHHHPWRKETDPISPYRSQKTEDHSRTPLAKGKQPGHRLETRNLYLEKRPNRPTTMTNSNSEPIPEKETDHGSKNGTTQNGNGIPQTGINYHGNRQRPPPLLYLWRIQFMARRDMDQWSYDNFDQAGYSGQETGHPHH